MDEAKTAIVHTVKREDYGLYLLSIIALGYMDKNPVEHYTVIGIVKTDAGNVEIGVSNEGLMMRALPYGQPVKLDGTAGNIAAIDMTCILSKVA